MTTTLLPSAIKASKKTISADSITSVSKSSSSAEKLEGIRKFLTLDFKRDRSSFIMKRRQRQDEKRKLREENLEKKKESKFSLPSVNIANPLQDIFSSIGNFLLFLGGGILFNKFFDLEKGLMGVAKILPAIGKGIEFIESVVGAVTNFIDSSVKGYDNFMKSFENITGIKKEDVEKFLEDFKFVINGAVIGALAVLRSLPGIITGRRMGKPKPGVKPLATQRPPLTRLGRNAIVKVLGKSGARTFLKFSKRFISPQLNKIPLIGGILDFLFNYFILGESLQKSAFVATAASLGGILGGAVGTFIGGPVGTWVGGALGATGGDWAGRAIYDGIFGDKDPNLSAGIDSSAEYDQILEYNNTLIQPIVIS